MKWFTVMNSLESQWLFNIYGYCVVLVVDNFKKAHDIFSFSLFFWRSFH
jgi:hypothetical protein